MITMDPTQHHYQEMLDKYQEVDEDEILANLTAEELLQLEGEIEREVFNQAGGISTNTEDHSSLSPDRYSTSSYSSSEENILLQCNYKNKEPIAVGNTTYSHFETPPLRKRKSKEDLKRQKCEDCCEMKKELVQAVKKRTKRCANLFAADHQARRRRTRKRSDASSSSKKIPVNLDKETFDKISTSVNQEILSKRPNLKKVYTREPAKIDEMLHGMSLRHVTSNIKKKPKSSSNIKEKTQNASTSGLNLENITLRENSFALGHRLPLKTIRKPDQNTDQYIEDDLSTSVSGTCTDSSDVIGELSINSNSVEETIERVWENDPKLKKINLNNIQNVNMELFEELSSAMEMNMHVKDLSLANVGLTDRPARALARMLKQNETLEILNIESNFITGNAALRLVTALRKNNSLTELKLDNQRHIFGAKVEHEFPKIMKENKTLLRFGYQFANPGPRMSTSNLLTRNMDEVRKKRVFEQKKRTQSGQIPVAIRHQTSSEWHRRQKAEMKQVWKERGVSFDETGVVQDEDVQKVLEQIHPMDFSLLEQWFYKRLFGKTETKAAEYEAEINEKTFEKSESKCADTEQDHAIIKKRISSVERPSTPLPPKTIESSLNKDTDKTSHNVTDNQASFFYSVQKQKYKYGGAGALFKQDDDDSREMSNFIFKNASSEYRNSRKFSPDNNDSNIDHNNDESCFENSKASVINDNIGESFVIEASLGKSFLNDATLICDVNEKKQRHKENKFSDEDEDEDERDTGNISCDCVTKDVYEDDNKIDDNGIDDESNSDIYDSDNESEIYESNEKIIDCDGMKRNNFLNSENGLKFSHVNTENCENHAADRTDLCNFQFNGRMSETSKSSSQTTNDDIIEWKEGNHYDSDEYEIVEIEVTESEESDSDEQIKSNVTHGTANTCNSQAFSVTYGNICNTENVSVCRTVSILEKSVNNSKESDDKSSSSADEELSKLRFRSTCSKQMVKPTVFLPIQNLASMNSSDDSQSAACSPVSLKPEQPNHTDLENGYTWTTNRPFYNFGAE